MHYNNESFSYSFMIIISKVMTYETLKCFQIARSTVVCRTQLMVLAQSRGAALNKGFADIKQSGRNSGFRSKVGVQL